MTTTTSADPTAADQARDRILLGIEAGIAAGPFRADWDSLRSGYQVPARYADGKFGIFLHWAAPAYPATATSGAPRQMYRQGTDGDPLRGVPDPGGHRRALRRPGRGQERTLRRPLSPGTGAEMRSTSVELYRYPDGPVWTADA